jgi:thymidine phosphorylase
VQAGAGVVLHAKPGDPVRRGAPLFSLCTDDTERFARAEAALADAVVIDIDPGAGASTGPRDIVLGRIT